MESIAEILEQELENAVEVKDQKALHRYILLLTESVVSRENYKKDVTELKSEIRLLAETMKQGFASMDKRFEDVNSRFGDINTRFEDFNRRFDDVNQRFEDVNKRFDDVNQRFEDVNKRFEDVNQRFNDMDRRFTMMFAFMNIGFTILILITVIFKFIA